MVKWEAVGGFTLGGVHSPAPPSVPCDPNGLWGTDLRAPATTGDVPRSSTVPVPRTRARKFSEIDSAWLKQQVSWSGTLHAVLSCQKNEFTKTSQNHFLIFVVRPRVTSILKVRVPTWTRVTAASMLPGRSNGQVGQVGQVSISSLCGVSLNTFRCAQSRKIGFMLSWPWKKHLNLPDSCRIKQCIRGKFPAAFCTRQHQCCALVVVAAFESHGCHGCHSTMSDSKSLEQSVRGDVHRFWWYHPGATHLQWVSLHWTASLKLKMKLPRSFLESSDRVLTWQTNEC